MIRKFAASALVFSALLAAPSPARAADDVGLMFYEKQAKDVLKTAGDKVWSAADDARRQNFFQFAEEQAQRALEFDPDQADARKYLQFEKKDGKWVQNADGFAKLPHQNTHPNTESQENLDKRIKKWQDETLAKADKFVAAKYAELGDLCASKGYADQATKGYEAAMRLDKDNEKARKGLGYIKFGKTWLTKKQDDARKAASKAVEVKESSKSGWEEFFGVTLHKVESAHIRIESGFPVEELVKHCEAAETAYAYYLADFTRDPAEDVFGAKYTFMIMDTEPEWDKFVDAYGGNEKEFIHQLSSCGVGELSRGLRGGTKNKEVKKDGGKTETELGSSPEARRDQIVHSVIHEMNRRVWHLDTKAWLDEGLAYYYSLKALETCLTHCVAIKRGDYANGHQDEGGIKKWDNPDGWKPLLKAMVKKKDDVALRTIMLQPLTKLDFIDTVKGWGVASYLMDLDRSKFMDFLAAMMDGKVKQEDALQNTYGKGIEAIDDDWRAYALHAY